MVLWFSTWSVILLCVTLSRTDRSHRELWLRGSGIPFNISSLLLSSFTPETTEGIVPYDQVLRRVTKLC